MIVSEGIDGRAARRITTPLERLATQVQEYAAKAPLCRASKRLTVAKMSSLSCGEEKSNEIGGLRSAARLRPPRARIILFSEHHHLQPSPGTDRYRLIAPIGKAAWERSIAAATHACNAMWR